MDNFPGLRPRTVGEILDSAFTLYRRRFWPLLLVATVYSVPTLVVSIIISSDVSQGVHGTADAFGGYYRALERTQGRIDDSVIDAYLKTLAKASELNGILFLSEIAQSVSRGAACVAAATVAWAAVRGEETPTAMSMLRTTLPRIFPATLIWVIASIVSGICCICFPVPILTYAVLAPAAAVLVLERGTFETSVAKWTFAPARIAVAPFAATTDAIARCCRLSFRSMTLVRGSFVMILILMFVSLLVTVLSAVAGWLGDSVAVGFIANHYGEILFLPVVGTAGALWYVDLRVRREGIDFSETP